MDEVYGSLEGTVSEMPTRKERVTAAILYLPTVPPLWMFIEIILQFLVYGKTLNEMITPQPIRRLLPLNGLLLTQAVTSTLVLALSWKRSPFLRRHAGLALGIGITSLAVLYGQLVAKMLIRQHLASSGVLDCTSGPGCMIDSFLEGLFGVGRVISIGLGVLGIILAVGGSERSTQ